MSDLAMDDVLLGLRDNVLLSPTLAALPAHLMNQTFSIPDEAYWVEHLEITSEEVSSLGGRGNHTIKAQLEYIVELRFPKDEGTGRVWQTAREVADLCPPGFGVILASGQATVMDRERLGPRIEEHEFVMRVRMDVLAYSRV